MTQTISNICYNRIILANDVPCFNKISALDYIEKLHKSVVSSSKKPADAYRLFISELVSNLCSCRNSIFLSTVDMYSKATKKHVGTAVNYIVCGNLNNQLAVKQINIVVINWKRGLKYNASECIADKNLIITYHAIERLLLRNEYAAIRKNPDLFMYLVKHMVLQIASDVIFTNIDMRSYISKIAVSGGYFPVIQNDNNIFLTTFVDEGLYTDEQSYIKNMSEDTIKNAQRLVYTFNEVQDNGGTLTVHGRKCDIKNVQIFFPTAIGLSQYT